MINLQVSRVRCRTRIGVVAAVALTIAASPSRVAALEDVSQLVGKESSSVGDDAFIRGDCNGDGGLDLSDAVCMLLVLFTPQETACNDALDANDDGAVDVSDPIGVLSYLFLAKSPPEAPYPQCGTDPTLDQLPATCRFDVCSTGETMLVKLVNSSKEDVLAPLIAVVESVTPAGVQILNPDGTYEGKPYFEYTPLLSEGALAAGKETSEKLWELANPTGGLVTLKVRVYGNRDAGAGWLPGSDPLGEETPPPERTTRRTDLEGVEYDLTTPGFSFRRVLHEETEFHALKARQGGRLDLPGRPGIPTLTQFVGIPQGAQLVAELEEGEEVTYEGILVEPTQYSAEDNRESPEPPFVINDKIYAGDRPYPENLLQVREVEFRGLRLAVVRVALARTNTARRELTIYPKMRVRLRFGGTPAKSPSDFIDPVDRDLETESLLSVVALNHNVFRVEPDTVISDRVRLHLQDLLIIAPREFETEAEDLAEWKESRGLTTIVAYTDTIGDTAADIESYIRLRRILSGISYVLLFGDAEHIPPHYRTRHPTAHGFRRIGTDLFYATLGGEDDILPDLAIGRIPASSDEEAAAVVEKIQSYEGINVLAGDFYRRAVVAAYFQDGGDDGTADRLFAQTSEEIYSFLDGAGYSPERVYTTESSDPEFWENGVAIPDALEKPGFPWDGDTADITDGIEAGAFLVTHRDHADWTGWGSPSYTRNNVDNLTNGDLLPVVFSINCQSGWFDRETDEEGAGTTGESFAEHFLLNENGGAVAVVAATRNSRSWINDEFVKGMMDCIWPAMIPDYPAADELEAVALAGSRRLGDVLNYGKLRAFAMYPDQIDGYTDTDNPDNITSYQRLAEIFHLIGDPTLRIHTSNPLLLVAALPRVEPFVTEFALDFPREFDGATLAVVQGGKVVGQGYVDKGKGRLVFPQDAPLRGDRDTTIVASKDGCLPFREKLELTASCTLYCLAVPRDPAGNNGIADLGARTDGSLVSLSYRKLKGTGRQSCCESEIAAGAKWLFAGHNTSGGIEMMRFGSNGALEPLAGSPFGTKGGQPSYLAVTAEGNRLLATTSDSMVEVFAISANGLSPLAGSPVSVKGQARDVETYAGKSDTFVYVGSMTDPPGVFIYRLLSTGLEYRAVVDLSKLGASRPGFDVIAARGGHLLVRDLDRGIYAFEIDPVTGALSLVKGSPFPVGGLSTSLGITRSGAFAYVATQMQEASETVCFRIETGGRLTALERVESPPLVVDFTTDCADGILYGASSFDRSVVSWAIQNDGTLKRIEATPVGDGETAPAGLLTR